QPGRRVARPPARQAARVLQGRRRELRGLDRRRLAANGRPRVPRRRRLQIGTRSASCSSACPASGASTTRTTARAPRPGPTTAGCERETSRTSTPTASDRNQVGELLVRLPGKRREYYKDDGASSAAWTDDGWLRTGDLAYLDADGFVYISGRIKDMIIRGGNNIYATDVEAVILEHPAVREAAVVGVPHEVLGEDVGAFVVRKAGIDCSNDELLAFCAEHLADYKRPRKLWFVDELPRNATGKVMKHKLREEIAGPRA